jgi:hypothetical protein
MPVDGSDTSDLPDPRLLKIVALRLSAWLSPVLLKMVRAKLSDEKTTKVEPPAGAQKTHQDTTGSETLETL